MVDSGGGGSSGCIGAGHYSGGVRCHCNNTRGLIAS